MPVSADYVARETASNLWRNRLMTIAAVLTVGVSLSLVGASLLLRQGVALTPLTEARAVARQGVQVRHVLTGDTRLLSADAVVVACGGCADDALYRAMEGWPIERFLIGDALSPRRVHDALLEGTRAARAL